MKAPKSAGKSVHWGVRVKGETILYSAEYKLKGDPVALIKRWTNGCYELVKITTEPVAETNKRKST